MHPEKIDTNMITVRTSLNLIIPPFGINGKKKYNIIRYSKELKRIQVQKSNSKYLSYHFTRIAKSILSYKD